MPFALKDNRWRSNPPAHCESDKKWEQIIECEDPLHKIADYRDFRLEK